MKNIVQLYQGKVLDLQRESWELPDGREAEFEIVRHPGGAAILPILPDGRLLLLRQFRPAANGYVVEIPAGRLEAGEGPQQCAVRELQEEAGWQTGKVTPLGTVFSTPGFCDERIHLFLAEQLTPDVVSREPDEFIELFEIDLAGALDMIERGEIPDSKTQLAILTYARLTRSG
jgi:ADP-ribose pyrophosphatase